MQDPDAAAAAASKNAANAAKAESEETAAFPAWLRVLGAAATGGVAVAAAPAIVGAVVGVGAAGPVAGGAFAAMQGAGLVAGGMMAGVQAFVMGGVPVAAVALGTLAGAFVGRELAPVNSVYN